MNYISSPSTWFLRDKTSISGLSKQGVREITSQNIKVLSLPSEKDGVVFDSVQDVFYRQLETEAPSVEEICYPPTMEIRVLSGTKDEPLPKVNYLKRIKICNVKDITAPVCHLCFNDCLEYIDMPDSKEYKTQDGIVYSKGMDKIRLINCNGFDRRQL